MLPLLPSSSFFFLSSYYYILYRVIVLLLGERNRLPSHEGIPSCAFNRKSGIIINRLAEILTWHYPVVIDRNINLASSSCDSLKY